MTLAVGLKEWAVVCHLLGSGRLMLLVRKGGIRERRGGLFVPEHPRFLLLPTFEHQAEGRIVPGHAAALAATTIDLAPGRFRISHWAEVVRTWRVADLDRFGLIADELAFTTDEIATRFHYRNQPWLSVLAVRVHRLAERAELPITPAYAGCRSWVALREQVPAAAAPVVDDAAFAIRLARLERALHA